MPNWADYALVISLGIYMLMVAALMVAGRRADARAVAGFIPDCVALFSRLMRDGRLARRDKLFVAALIPYLATPFDLVPDFVPVAGQLDDAVVVALVLRRLARKHTGLIREHWPGPPASLRLVLRLAGSRPS